MSDTEESSNATDTDTDTDTNTSTSATENANRETGTGTGTGTNTDPIAVTSEIDDINDTSATVSRSASLAEVVSEPREILDHEQFESDFDLYERLLEIDPELAGTVRAQAQLASGFELIHPTHEGELEQPTELDKVALEDCQKLVDHLDLDLSQPSMFKNMIANGNDVSKIIYTDGVGVTGLQSLPLRSLTIVDESTALGIRKSMAEARKSNATDEDEIDIKEYKDNLNREVIQNGDLYVLNEGTLDMKQIDHWKILHVSTERRGNWFTDQFERKTYGVWGAPRIEPTKFSLQAKHNTLTNKVAMDDSLIAREIYQIDVATLFGHINNDEKREKKAKDYASELKETLESMQPDEKPILPDEVSVSVQGPEGKAKEHGDFLDLMNDSIMHALTFNVSGVGRDAGGPMIGNRPAKDTSLNNVQHLRETLGRQFRKLFRFHLLVKHPEWRAEMPDTEDISTWKLRDDIILPDVKWSSLEDGDVERIGNTAAKLYEHNIITRNEAREMMGKDPIPDDEIERLFQDQVMNMEIQTEFNKLQQQNTQEFEEQRQQLEDTQNQDQDQDPDQSDSDTNAQSQIDVASGISNFQEREREHRETVDESEFVQELSSRLGRGASRIAMVLDMDTDAETDSDSDADAGGE